MGRYEFGEGELAEAHWCGPLPARGLLVGPGPGNERDASLWHSLMRKLGGSGADIEMLAPKLPVCSSDRGRRAGQWPFGDSRQHLQDPLL